MIPYTRFRSGAKRILPWARTDRSGARQGVVELVLQAEDEARAELETLFYDPGEVEKRLRHMPLEREAGPA